MPATTVGNEVDHHVFLELLAELHGEPGNAHHGFGVVSVDVPNGGLNRLGHVGGVDRRARLPGGSREADLIVDRDVYGATDAVAAQLRHLHAFVDHALSAHGGIAVNQNGKGGEGSDGLEVLLSPDDALQHAIDGLEVRGVSGEEHRNLATVATRVGSVGTEVVLHVARALDGARVDIALELAENLTVGLSRDVGQHVEASAVRHADAHAIELVVGGLLQNRVEQGDQ